MYEKEGEESIWKIAFDDDYSYAGTSDDGVILRSSDRFHWEKYMSVEDDLVTALLSFNDYLFIGTSPNGKIYRKNKKNDDLKLDIVDNGEITGFCIFNGEVYAAKRSTPKIYKFSFVNESWSTFYEPCGSSINQMSSFSAKIWISLDYMNLLSYDGFKWKLEAFESENVSTHRRISKNVFSHVTYSFVDTKEIKTTEGMQKEDILDIFPYNRTIGINSFSRDGDSITLGGKNKGRVLNYQNGSLFSLFDTDEDSVQSIINLDVGVNLAAIGSYLYLVYCGDILNVEPPEVTEGENPNENKNIYIISPNGGENLVVGGEYEILWSSNKSVNDSVRLSLYKSGTEVLTISDNTANSGFLVWQIPITIDAGNDYKVYIEWLSASESPNEEDFDFSDSNFSILFSEVSIQEPEVVEASGNFPDVSKCRGVPVLRLPNNEKITYMTKDPAIGGVLFATSRGRILYSEDAFSNAIGSGERLVYANVRNGYGSSSDTSSSNFFYSLYKRLLETSSSKAVDKIKYKEETVVYPNEKISAFFLSPILKSEEDIGFWKSIFWSENKLEKTKIKICIRSGESENELLGKEWGTCFQSSEGESSPISRELNNLHLDGDLAQIKVVMETESDQENPSVTDLGLVYSSKRAQYFYTIKFSLERNSNINKGLITATVTEPLNTEVIFGYSDINSSNWEDYKIIDRDSFFDMENIDNVKIGAKMVSYDGSLPSIDEFSIIFSGDKLNGENR